LPRADTLNVTARSSQSPDLDAAPARSPEHSLVVEGLGKRYFVASKKPAEVRRTLNLGVTRVPLPRWGRTRGEQRELWALRNVSFGAPRSTILGILGANGAGKSTLLKIIARVTRPTEGRVAGTGRVVSLLELGAGFNPDFSARDNILMNAAMHGISRSEALERMSAIVQFAELDEFLENPLRQYSSGMYLRLAFSVAINMQPDILLADEILAVGDMAFQERCLERVALEAERGLTVLFVSHDLSALSRLCHRILWLDKGTLVRAGDPEPIIAEYEEAALRGKDGKRGFGERTGRHTNVEAEIASVRLLNAAGEEIGAAPTFEDVHIRVRLKVRKPGRGLRGAVDVHAKGVFLFRTVQPQEIVADHRGVFDLLVRIPARLLAETTYLVNVTVYTRWEKESKIVLDNALTFLAYGEQQPEKSGVRSGVIAPRLEWRVQDHVNARKRRKSVV
jgi:lipopolysaccharide transport system ATP-binding protein